jgi:excisionase family DNA binding protein
MKQNGNSLLQYLERIDARQQSIENLLSTSKTVLNLDEVCIFTGLSKSHLYKLTCAGRIPYYKQSKHLFFDRAEIESWLKENRHKPVSEIEALAATYVTINKKSK